jgi:hypothetical protein
MARTPEEQALYVGIVERAPAHPGWLVASGWHDWPGQHAIGYRTTPASRGRPLPRCRSGQRGALSSRQDGRGKTASRSQHGRRRLHQCQSVLPDPDRSTLPGQAFFSSMMVESEYIAYPNVLPLSERRWRASRANTIHCRILSGARR